MMSFVLNITALLFIAYSLLIIFYYRGWMQAPEFRLRQEKTSSSVTITVIIPARNEAINIRACLNALIAQSYSRNLTEIIVVDDHSTDDTASIVRTFSKYNVKLLLLKDYISGNLLNSYKKKAIEIGIGQALGTLIVTTDADCMAPADWLKTIAAFYEKEQPVFIAAPVAYLQSPERKTPANRLLEIFQSLDFMSLQGITAAAVHRKMHSMCNGANLAYQKSVFYEVEGFKGIDHIASGDDMLLMHKMYKQYPDKVLYLKSTSAIVETRPAASLKAFLNQRIRWASKADKYEDKRIFYSLLLVYCFNVWMVLLALLSLWKGSLLWILLCLWAGKSTVELLFLYPVSVFFSRTVLLWWFPLAQPFHIIYTVIAGWLGKFGSYQWKERTVR